MADPALDEALKRNCEALVAGNIAQLFVDLSPQAVVKLSQSAAAQVAGSMPKLTAYEVIGRESNGDLELCDVRFTGEVNFGIKASWQRFDGAWKIVDFDSYQW